MKTLAARQSALLALLFVAVYGGCNWIAAQRTDVGVWYFEWERHLPFWPPMIIPYLSLDAFFLAAPFLCRDREELAVLSRRIIVAILVAGVCFVSMPLRFTFERPAVDGRLGTLFQSFASIDQPFNLFPSLHITLAVILADTYRRHSKGILRLAASSWFMLIGASAIFTYQHHVIDVVGGLVLAAMTFYVVRERTAQHPHTRNIRVAAYYLLAAWATAAMAAVLWPWGALLLWPAFSLAVVSSAYWGMGSWIFAKSNGRIPLSTWVLLWPCLAGHRLSLAYYRRQCRAYDAIAPEIWIGRRLDDREAAKAVAKGVSAVIDLTAELDETPIFANLPYKNLQTLDLTAPAPESLQEAVRFIRDHSHRGVVMVHCKIGYSRSAAVVGAYLLAVGRAHTTDEALAMIRRARPQVVVRPEAVAALRRFEARCVERRIRRTSRPSVPCAVLGTLFASVARLFCGSPRWLGSTPSTRQRIYFANHTSHLDFLAVWGALPADVRVEVRPVAGRDYWDRDPIRRFLARRVFRAVLVDRRNPQVDVGREATIAVARRSVERTARALATGASLIIFPEGTRGSGDEVGPFKSGLYHLCRMHPDVELVPVFLENFNRILPKGEFIPLPLSGAVTFGPPIRLRPGEDKNNFLARARAALVIVSRPCSPPSTAISRAS